MAHAASQLKKNRDLEINAEEETEKKRKHRKRSRDRKKKVAMGEAWSQAGLGPGMPFSEGAGGVMIAGLCRRCASLFRGSGTFVQHTRVLSRS